MESREIEKMDGIEREKMAILARSLQRPVPVGIAS